MYELILKLMGCSVLFMVITILMSRVFIFKTIPVTIDHWVILYRVIRGDLPQPYTLLDHNTDQRLIAA